MDECPTCKREFKNITEYPYIQIVGVKVIKLSEVPKAVLDWHKERNYTPEIRKLLKENQALKQYFIGIEQLIGKTVPTDHVLPSWEQTERFSVYRIPDSGLLLDLCEGDRQEDCRVSDIDLMDKGPNLGSAGGPTLSVLLCLGQIMYNGAISDTQENK